MRKGKTRYREILLTPELAESFLGRNPDNYRRLSGNVVQHYTRLMREGKWKFNGDTICFDENGNLSDGQHRCAAVVASGVTIRVLLVEGLESDASLTIDNHRVRVAADDLRRAGHSDPNSLTSAARYLTALRTGWGKYQSSRDRLSRTEVLGVVEENPGLSESVSIARRVKGTPPGLMGALHYRLAENEPDLANEFFAQLANGSNLAPDSPVLHLRNWIERTNIGMSNNTGRLLLAGMTILTWNKMRERKPVLRKLRFNPEDYNGGLPRIL